MDAVLVTDIATPLGSLRAYATSRGLCALEFTNRAERIAQFENRLQRWFGAPRLVPCEHEMHGAVRQWLERYFAGELTAPDIARGVVPDVALDIRGTEHELATWTALQDILPGHTCTYGELARQLARPTAARAVGMAVGRNPLSIVIPCHRVVGARGALTGYGGGLERKRWLLAHEQAHTPLLLSG